MADPTTALSVLTPEVRTLAYPASGVLLSARGVVQRSEDVRGVFLRAKTEGWGAERLADALAERLGPELTGDAGAVREAALYLADEFLQLGDRLLLVSRETGRALASITDDDLWQPPAVPREGGGLAKPLPRLRPELEAFLYQHIHEHDREAQLLASLAVRTHQTAFLAEEGDRRLNVATRAGRRAIEAEIQARGSNLFDSLQSTGQSFLQLFAHPPTPGMTPALAGIAMARTRTHITDAQAINYRFDHAGSQYASLTGALIRELAFALAIEAHRQKPPAEVSYERMAVGDLGGAAFWLVDPQLSAAFMRFPGISVMYIPGVPPTGFLSPAGSFAMEAGSLKIEGREVFDRWDVMGRFSYTVHLDWGAVRTLLVTDAPQPAAVAEVVPR